jgi:hypothetical protein
MQIKARHLIQNFQLPEWSVPLILLALCFFSFGLLAPKLGLYWDDWSKTLVNRLWGLSGYWQYYAEDRPISSWTHIFFISLLGDQPFRWQVIVFSLRWLSSIALWWTLRGLWPSSRRLAALTACLFVVYPLFTQQAIAVTYHQQWLQYLFCLLSFGFMVYGIRIPRYKAIFTLFSLSLLILQLSITEYFIGVELLRPLVVWFAVGSENHNIAWNIRSRKWFSIFLPYLLVDIAYIVWRLFLIRFTGIDPFHAETLYRFFITPLQTLKEWSLIAWRDSIQMLISHWYRTFQPDLFSEKTQWMDWISWMIALTVGMLIVGFSYSIQKINVDESKDFEQSAAVQAMLLGGCGLLLGAIPAWITGRMVIFDFHSDRYALPSMLGISLLTVGFFEWLTPYRFQKAIILGIFIGLAVGFNLRTTNEFRWDWTNQQRFYWQLFWRAPYLKPGTALLTDQEPFPNQGLFSFSSAINLLYPQPKNPKKLPYWVYALGRKYTPNTIPKPLDTDLYTRFRSLIFEGNTSESIAFYFDPSQATCLWVFGSESIGDPGLSPLGDDLARASNLQRIVPNPMDNPPADLFGAEIPHSWCYYFEKADLARQVGDWTEVVRLGDDARKQGYSPQHQSSNTAHEWLPFLQGYARLGRWADVKQINEAIVKVDPRYQAYLCTYWKKMSENGNDLMDGQSARSIYHQMVCNN